MPEKKHHKHKKHDKHHQDCCCCEDVEITIKGGCMQSIIKVTFHIAPGSTTGPGEITAGKTEFAGKVGEPLDDSLQLSGGTPPFSVIVTEGDLPAGVFIDSDGNVSGTPEQEGDFEVVCTINDSVA